MFKNKTIKLFLILGVILFSTILVSCNSSTSNDFYNDFFVEIYDGKIIVGNGEIERFFQLTNKDKQKAKIEIKKTILLNKEKCDEEYYEEHKDEYPKISTRLICFNGNEYTYSYNEQEERTYKYLKCEKIFYTSESDEKSFHKEYYLVNDDNITYSSFISSSFSSSFGAINLYDLAHIISLFEYKDFVFTNSNILSFTIKNKSLDIITIKESEKYQFFNSPYKLLSFFDSLKWKLYKDNLELFYDNYIIVETERTLIKDENGVLTKSRTDNFYYLYVINLKNNIVFLENYDGKKILYAEFDKADLINILSNFDIFIE
ncbi:MAG: hypothetical protein E7339_00960 [Clostridiales bacterium]|nr:hypothetical protein [Clostridiales bacterium]